MKNFMFSVLTFIVGSVLLATMLLCSCSSSINLKDCIDVTFDGYDGYGKADITVDYGKLDSKTEEGRMKHFEKSLDLPNDPSRSLSDMFTFSIADNDKALKNGDTVTVTVSVSNRYSQMVESVESLCAKMGYTAPATEIKFKANGLEKPKVETVDLEKLISIDFGKYNGYGNPTVTLNDGYMKELINSDILNGFISSNNALKGIVSSSNENTLFSPTFDKAYSGLKNGDKVKVKIDVPKSISDAGFDLDAVANGLYLKFPKTEIEYKVSGLEDAKNVFDLFEGIEKYIIYKGANGKGKIDKVEFPKDYKRQVGELYLSRDFYVNRIKIVYNNEMIGTVTYDCNDNADNLSQGDTVTITTLVSPEKLAQLGYIIPTTEKQFTVPDLGEYLKDKNSITPSILAELKDRIMSKYSSDDTLEEIYAGSILPGVVLEYDSPFCVSAIVDDNGWFSHVNIASVYNIIIKDGKVTDAFILTERTYKDTVEEARAYLNTDEYSLDLIP